MTSIPAWHASRAKRLQAWAIATAGYPLVAGLGATLRWRVEGLAHFEDSLRAGRPPILAFWHGRILLAVTFFHHRGIVAMVSENFDGEWISRIVERMGYRTARGSTSRGGARAMVQLRRVLAEGHPAGFTLDGPRGPARVAQPGAVWLAKATGHPIVPFHAEAARFWSARSWDATQVPWPFSRATMCIGAPIEVPREADEPAIDAARRELEVALEELARRARELTTGAQS